MEELGTMFTENCARILNIRDRGKIEVGHRDDFAITDENFHVAATIMLGKLVYRA